jgi:hypothetical protein
LGRLDGMECKYSSFNSDPVEMVNDARTLDIFVLSKGPGRFLYYNIEIVSRVFDAVLHKQTHRARGDLIFVTGTGLTLPNSRTRQHICSPTNWDPI